MSLSTIRSSLFLVLLVGKPNFTLTRSFIFVHSLRLFLSTSSASGFLFAKRAAAVYLYQADNDGGWGELRFDLENGTAEIVKLADWDTTKSNIFAKTATRHIQSLPEAKPPSEVVVMFDQAM